MSTGIQRKNAKTIVIVSLCLCIIACSVGGVIAYLMAKTGPISNEFVPAKVSCSVEENFADGVKSNVTVKNTGNIDAYIRATVVATFVSEDGKVLAKAPKEGVDYIIQWGTDGWIQGQDGYWYHTKPVKPEETTALLIESAFQALEQPDFQLNIQILATAVQSAPELAVQEAWGVTVSNGEIAPPIIPLD